MHSLEWKSILMCNLFCMSWATRKQFYLTQLKKLISKQKFRNTFFFWKCQMWISRDLLQAVYLRQLMIENGLRQILQVVKTLPRHTNNIVTREIRQPAGSIKIMYLKSRHHLCYTMEIYHFSLRSCYFTHCHWSKFAPMVILILQKDLQRDSPTYQKPFVMLTLRHQL